MNWTGHLSRTDVITGELRDRWGWILNMTGTPDGRRVYLTASLAKIGDPAITGEEADFHHEIAAPGAFLTGFIDRTRDGWHGTMAGIGARRMALTGVSAEPGVINLRGQASVVWQAAE